MGKEAKTKRKVCGNCGNHNAYNYPDEVFCTMRLCSSENPIVPTLWCCEKWNPTSQDCYCVEEALKKQNN